MKPSRSTAVLLLVLAICSVAAAQCTSDVYADPEGLISGAFSGSNYIGYGGLISTSSCRSRTW